MGDIWLYMGRAVYDLHTLDAFTGATTMRDITWTIGALIMFIGGAIIGLVEMVKWVISWGM